jgi:predicted phage-related endonuclease
MEPINIMSTINRGRGIGGSDAMRIARGEWRALYMEKLRLTEPEDLSNVFKVQLGITTEPLHARWFTKITGLPIETAAPFMVHRSIPHMYANLDGWVTHQGTFVELKHTNARATLREKARYYMPQLQHYIEVADVPYCYFSIIKGNDDPEFCLIDRNQTYIDELIKMEEAFWWHVQHKVPPDIEPKGQAAALEKETFEVLIDGLRTVDMTTNNQWVVFAQEWQETRDAAARHEVVAKEIKSLVPDDAAEAFGSGVIVRRDRRNRLSLRAMKEEP